MRIVSGPPLCAAKSAIHRPWHVLLDSPDRFLLRQASSVVTRHVPNRCSSSSSTTGALTNRYTEAGAPDNAATLGRLTSSCLERLPTSSILRSLLLGYFFSSPILLKPGFAILRRIADSKSSLLNPDLNPLLRAVLRPLLYDQFCAGTNRNEISRTKQTIKNIGYSGIILCYGKEIQFSRSAELRSMDHDTSQQNVEITEWRDGNLRTLDMIGSGDWLGIKYVVTLWSLHLLLMLLRSQIHRGWLRGDSGTHEWF